MDAKITKKRLGLLLSYDWLKIVGICVAAVLVWSLLFTTMATRATNGQSFDMYLYPGVRLGESANLDTLHTRDRNDALSYDVLDLSFTTLESSTMDTILSAHFAAGQGDVLFSVDLEPTVDEESGEVTYNGLDNFISRYYSNALWLGTDMKGWQLPNSSTEKANYFADCEAYLNNFYDGGWETGTLNEEKVRSHFNERMEGDKRYKNEAQRELGRDNEVERIKNLRDAYAEVKGWIAVDDEGNPLDPNSPISVKKTEIEIDLDGDGETEAVEWQYAFDLSNIDRLTEFVSYPDENGTGSREGLCMVVLNTGSSGEEDLRYEPFTLLKYLVDTYDGAAA